MGDKKKFEDLMDELESIVKQLEGGNIGLEKSILEFEKGMKLVRKCEVKLEEAKGKIEKLVKDAGGGMKEEPFDSK